MDIYVMKKTVLRYTIIMMLLLTSCGSKEINNDTSSNELETTTEMVINNETIVTTSEPKIVTKLSTENNQIELGIGETFQLEYTIAPEDTPEEYREILWNSTDETIVSVDSNGILTGVDSGMCTVIATSKNNPDVVLKYSVTVTGNNSNTTQVVLGSTIFIPTNEFTTTTVTTTTTAPIITTPIPEDTTPVPNIDETQPPEDNSLEENTYTPPTIQPTYINGILIVNSKYPIPKDYVPESWGTYGLVEEVQNAFDMMNTDAINEGLNLLIYSGYVSYDEQNNTYQNAINSYGQEYADKYVDTAGYSESQTGLTIMLNSANSDFDSTAEASWLAENCYKYGFIIRYPQGKENITGKEYRSYQIRYVGVDIATEIYNNNLCLEEYLNA